MWKHAKEKEKEVFTNAITTQLVMTVALIYVLLGALLLFVPQIKIITLCYFLCAVLVILGIVLIVRYFVTDAYRNINEYGFSLGVFTVILGMCALVRVQEVAGSFIICMGIALLMTSVIKLQNALDLKNLQEKTWGFMLFIALFFVVCSIVIIIDPFKQESTRYAFTYRILIIDGILTLLSNCYLFFTIRKNKKRTLAVPAEEIKETEESSVEHNEEEIKEEQ